VRAVTSAAAEFVVHCNASVVVFSRIGERRAIAIAALFGGALELLCPTGNRVGAVLAHLPPSLIVRFSYLFLQSTYMHIYFLLPLEARIYYPLGLGPGLGVYVCL